MINEIALVADGFTNIYLDPDKSHKCPSCGSILMVLDDRIPVASLIITDMIDMLEGKSEECCGYLAAICPKCQYRILTESKYSVTDTLGFFMVGLNQ